MKLDESEPLPTGPDETAGGQERSLETLAEVRRRALASIMSLNSQHHSFNNPILPKDKGTSPHSRANAQVLAYHTLLSKPSRFNQTDAWDFYKTEFTTVPVPAALVDGDGMPEIAVDDMNDPPRLYFDQLELKPVPFSLDKVDDWKNWTIRIKKVPGTPYLHYEDPEVLERKMALPPESLDELFRRLDQLADQYGVLVNIKDTDQDPYKV